LFREIEQDPKQSFSGERYAALYLSQKGTADDWDLLERNSEALKKKQSGEIDNSLAVLNARAFGTNLFDRLNGDRHYRWSTNESPFLPSVANTGPQAAYVYDLLKQALAKCGDAADIPPELVTMVVAFDADGKPFCNVDLAKYGLKMPDFTPTPSSAPSPLSAVTDSPSPAAPRTPPPAAGPTNAPAPSAEESPAVPPSRLRSAVPLAVGAGVLSALLLFLRFRKKGR
jgi:hypothetical protein